MATSVLLRAGLAGQRLLLSAGRATGVRTQPGRGGRAAARGAGGSSRAGSSGPKERKAPVTAQDLFDAMDAASLPPPPPSELTASLPSTPLRIARGHAQGADRAAARLLAARVLASPQVDDEDADTNADADASISERPAVLPEDAGPPSTAAPRVPSTPATVGDARRTRALLDAAAIQAKKALGQNFMTSERALASILSAARVQPGDSVLEVGPGTGNLTSLLLAAGATVTAVEKDDALAEQLRGAYAGVPAFRLEHADFLRWPLSEWAAAHAQQQPQRAKVVANLPFNITTDALKRLLPLGSAFSEVYLLLQEEAARRLVQTRVGQPDYRAINVRIGYYASAAKYRLTLSRAAFFPEPHVDAGLIELQLRRPEDLPHLTGPSAASAEPAAQQRAFVHLVNAAFSSRRKMIRNNLQAYWPPAVVGAALVSAGLSESSRPQELAVEAFVALFNALPPHERGPAALLADAAELEDELL